MSALAAELTLIDLDDQHRAEKVLEALGNKPTASIPAACGGWGETRAACLACSTIPRSAH